MTRTLWLTSLLITAPAIAQEPAEGIDPADLDPRARIGRGMQIAGALALGAGASMLAVPLATGEQDQLPIGIAGGLLGTAGGITFIAGAQVEAAALRQTLGQHTTWPGQVGLGLAAGSAVGVAIGLASVPGDSPNLVWVAVGGGALFGVATGFALGQIGLNAAAVHRMDPDLRRALYRPSRRVQVSCAPTFRPDGAGLSVAGLF